jgi:DNA-binding MurR/RpiR family transcriptional regulator
MARGQKVADNIRAEIAQMAAIGAGVDEIAEELDTPVSTVYRVLQTVGFNNLAGDPLTQAEVFAIVEAHYASKPLAEVLHQYNISEHVHTWLLRQAGINAHLRKTTTHEGNAILLDRAVQLYQQRDPIINVNDICKQCNVSVVRLYAELKERGIAKRGKLSYGPSLQEQLAARAAAKE